MDADRGSVTGTTMLSDLLQAAVTDSSVILGLNYIIIVVDKVKGHVQSMSLRSCTGVPGKCLAKPLPAL